MKSMISCLREPRANFTGLSAVISFVGSHILSSGYTVNVQ